MNTIASKSDGFWKGKKHTMLNREEAVNYPTEFLNSLGLPGMPPHNLILKKGVPIILLRNIHLQNFAMVPGLQWNLWWTTL